MKILDATCGERGIWYQKNLPFVTFIDKREGTFASYYSPKNKRYYTVNPDIVADWTKTLPFVWNKDEKCTCEVIQIGKRYEKCLMYVRGV